MVVPRMLSRDGSALRNPGWCHLPQSLRCNPRTFDQRGELCPSDIGMDLVAGGGGRKATVVACQDVLAPDDAREALNALRDEFRVLDLIDAVRDHARNEDLPRRQLDLLPDLPFVRVARVGRLDGIGLRL